MRKRSNSARLRALEQHLASFDAFKKTNKQKKRATGKGQNFALTVVRR
jgi:hypothetical protein